MNTSHLCWAFALQKNAFLHLPGLLKVTVVASFLERGDGRGSPAVLRHCRVTRWRSPTLFNERPDAAQTDDSGTPCLPSCPCMCCRQLSISLCKAFTRHTQCPYSGKLPFPVPINLPLSLTNNPHRASATLNLFASRTLFASRESATTLNLNPTNPFCK